MKDPERIVMSYLDGELQDDCEELERIDEEWKNFLKIYRRFVRIERFALNYRPSELGKKKFLRKLKKKKTLPYKIAITTCAILLGVFLVKGFVDYQSVENQYARIIQKGIEMINFEGTPTRLSNDDLLDKIRLVSDGL
ncbi:MAG: hypothetical protein J7L28_00440 [Thermotogae bacterium]|nr:hypothetical protein [Thermotogota bacterium]